MSLDKLIALGAEVVGGVAYLARKEVGVFNAGSFTVLPEGEAALADAAAAPAATARKRTAKPADAPAPAESQEDPLAGLDKVLDPGT